jgi:hypothetical protein
MHVAYQERNKTLQKLGFKSYAEYLASDRWKKIRAKVLRLHSRCFICRDKAQVVHHASYSHKTLVSRKGMRGKLYSLCFDCHERIEFDAQGSKLSPGQATRKMRVLAAQEKERWEMIEADLITLAEMPHF